MRRDAVRMELTEAEVKRVRQLASSWAGKSQRGRFKGSRPDEEGNFGGISAELKAAQFCRVPDRLNITIPDQGFDFVLPTRQTVDAKWTKKNTLPIYLPMRPGEFQADIAILATSTRERMVWLLGWITREDFDDYKFPHDFGYGRRLCVDHIRLQSMESLLVKTAVMQMELTL